MPFSWPSTQGWSGSSQKDTGGAEAIAKGPSWTPQGLMLRVSPRGLPHSKGPTPARRSSPRTPSHLLLSLQQTDTWSLKHLPELPGAGTAGLGGGVERKKSAPAGFLAADPSDSSSLLPWKASPSFRATPWCQASAGPPSWPLAPLAFSSSLHTPLDGPYSGLHLGPPTFPPRPLLSPHLRFSTWTCGRGRTPPSSPAAPQTAGEPPLTHRCNSRFLRAGTRSQGRRV